MASQFGPFDAVILQRHLPSRRELASLRRGARRLIFDFDDAVFHRDSFSPRGLESPRRRARFSAVVRAADVVVAGNAWLAERARRWPNTINPHLFITARTAVRTTPVCSAWISDQLGVPHDLVKRWGSEIEE